ncbi:MAG: glycosyltransferase [Candidatus Hydrogenedentota bacterium]|nr:MAG: glycosyltransferase [Candidatus Hydrogenedentota bacterium]
MKILHVYKDYYPPVVGGVEKHIAQLCNHFKHKYEVEALVCNRSPFTRIDTIDGVRVIKVGQIGRVQSAPLPPAFPLWLRKVKADILHYHVPNPTCEFSYLLARPPGSVVATYHSDIVRQETLLKFYRPFLRRFLAHARVIMPTSPTYIETSPFLRDFRAKCEVVPLGIDTRLFDSVGSTMRPAIEKLRTIFGPEFILFVGKLRYYKGLQFLIEAMPKIDVPLVVVGHGPMEGDLRALAANYRTAGKVHFIGEVTEEDLAVFYHACSLLVLPSVYRSEAYGLVQLEAHICGKPVVSTRLGTGVEFVNIDGKTGLIVPPADSTALARAINELLSDPARRKSMGEFARTRARNEFDFQQMFDKIETVYTRVLAKGH